MDFKNSGFMYLLGVLVGLFVIAQSVYFLVKAVRRSRELGIAGNVVKRTIASSAVFAILPSVSILLGLITLANTLGLPLPWIRLSVLGAVTYELPAATVALNALGESISAPVSGPLAFNTVAWVMTLGCITPLIIIPLFLKKIQGGVHSLRQKDSHWGGSFPDRHVPRHDLRLPRYGNFRRPALHPDSSDLRGHHGRLRRLRQGEEGQVA